MTLRLAMHRVSLRVGAATIIHPTSLDLGSGGLVAVVGPNGAGKSTLLRLLGGELTPTTGRITYGDASPADLTAAELSLLRAMVTQEGPIDIPFPARLVVALGRAPHLRTAPPSAADHAIVAATMEALGVDGLRDRIFATLSGGERSLISLARALVQETPVLLLDEPTESLDIAVEERTMGILSRLARRDPLVVAVIHDLNVVARHADRCVVLSNGKVVADGPPRQALSSELLSEVYAHPVRVIEHPLRGGPLIVVE